MNGVPLVTPPVQLQLVAPVPVKVTEEPTHTDDVFAVELTVGNAFTAMVTPFDVTVVVPFVKVMLGRIEAVVPVVLLQAVEPAVPFT